MLIPCEDNAFTPTLLQRFSMGVMFVLVLLSFSLANLQSLFWINSSTLVSSVLPSVIVDLTNNERADASVGGLKRNSVLDEAARRKAEDMAAKEYFAHYSPDGIAPWHWFDTVGYNFIHAGENLAVHFTDSEEVIEGWMNSPGHRANILDGKYTEIGVGTARGTFNGHETIFVVQMFGTPQFAQAAIPDTPALEPLVETIPDPTPEPVQVASETTVQPEPVPEPAAEPVVVQETAPVAIAEETPIPATEVTSDGSGALYSDLATTSRDAESAAGAPIAPQGTTQYESESSIFERFAVQPSAWLQIVYTVLAVMVVMALIASLILEWRRQHPVQLAYSGGLLATMFALFYIHTALSIGVTVI